MAGAYQKLGDSEAQAIYQRVIREYPDQKEAAALARARVEGTGAGGRDSHMVARQVWAAPPKGDIYGNVSRDGRLIPYVNWAESGNLFVHDLATGSDRRITNTANDGKAGVAGDYAEESTFSRDGKQLAYSWFKGKDHRYELRVVPLQGTAVPAPRQLFDREDVGWISPDDWSPDGKWLAVRLHRKDRAAEIGVIAVQDGSLRVLKSVDWRGPTHLFFSTDGKYLAFDLPAGEITEQRDVFVLATDGSQEIPVVVHPSQDVLVGWSPDGKRVLFASDRSGSMGLWGVGFADGKVQGAPQLLKPDIGRHEFMGLADNGAGTRPPVPVRAETSGLPLLISYREVPVTASCSDTDLRRQQRISGLVAGREIPRVRLTARYGWVPVLRDRNSLDRNRPDARNRGPSFSSLAQSLWSAR